MKRLRIVVPFLLFCLFHVGCATDRAANGGLRRYSFRLSLQRNMMPWSSIERFGAVRLLAPVRGGNLGGPLEKHSFSSSPHHLSTSQRGLSLRREVPLEDRNVWENLDREFLVALDYEAQVILWMKRARRYFPHIEKRLKRWGFRMI